MDIQTTKLVRGLGLTKLMAMRNLQTVEVNEVEEEREDVIEKLVSYKWYKDVIFYLRHLCCPDHLNKNKKRSLKLVSQKYIITDFGLAWKNSEGIFSKCITEDESPKIVVDFHGGVCGGHFARRVTTHKVLRDSYWWPTLFKDTILLVRKCESFQHFSRRMNASGSLPLHIISIEAPFKQWGMEFIGEISDPSSVGHNWILIAKNYFTKWVEAIPTKKETHQLLWTYC